MIFLLAVPAAAAGGTVIFSLYARIMSLMPFGCFAVDVFGLNCPLCGGTRCVRALFSGDIAAAFYYNPLVVLCAVFAAGVYIYVFCRAVSREYSPCLAYSERRVWTAAIIIIGFFVIRNLPIYRAFLF